MRIGDKLPDKLSIEIRLSETPGIYIAEIIEIEQMTQGGSIADAAMSAASMLKMLADECNDPNEKHCWCRASTFDDDTPAVECCLCETKKREEPVGSTSN
jgi:hypothetical protein